MSFQKSARDAADPGHATSIIFVATEECGIAGSRVDASHESTLYESTLHGSGPSGAPFEVGRFTRTVFARRL
jgi:hypothetical protein